MGKYLKNDTGKYPCPWCTRDFDKPQGVGRHIATAHPTRVQPNGKAIALTAKRAASRAPELQAVAAAMEEAAAVTECAVSLALACHEHTPSQVQAAVKFLLRTLAKRYQL